MSVNIMKFERAVLAVRLGDSRRRAAKINGTTHRVAHAVHMYTLDLRLQLLESNFHHIAPSLMNQRPSSAFSSSKITIFLVPMTRRKVLIATTNYKDALSHMNSILDPVAPTHVYLRLIYI